MRKRIYLNMALLAIVCLLVVSAVLCFLFYNRVLETVRTDIRQQTELFSGQDADAAAKALLHVRSGDIRFTLVAPDGVVLYDSLTPAETLENHKDRAEIADAQKNGWGESRRYSDTLGTETCYYAVRLSDGAVLRAAKTTHSIFTVFAQALPFVVLVLVLAILFSYVTAGRLTRRIVAPINETKLDGDELVPPYDELAPFVRALAEQRLRGSAQLREIRERTDTINAIMENMSEGAVIVSPDGTILSANRSALEIFGAEQQMGGRSIRTLFRDKTLLEHTDGALRGERTDMALERGQKYYQVFFSPVKGSGALLLFLDVTESAEAERLRREFSANVSHELKTPLTIITGSAEMLLGGMVKEADRQSFLRRIYDEAERLLALIEDIMLISRLDESPPEPFLEMKLQESCESAVSRLAPKAEASGISIHTGGDAPAVSASRSMLEELFFNLIDNAIKYNVPGGEVRIRFWSEEGRAAFSVADTGIGIPVSAQDRVFERFYRVEGSRSKKTGGTGLGLAIVKHIALMHGARLALESLEKEGTTITVRF